MKKHFRVYRNVKALRLAIYLVVALVTLLFSRTDALAYPYATVGTGLLSPFGVATDSFGNLYIADQTGEVYKVTPTGTQTTVISGLNPTSAGAPTGVAVDASGNIFITDNEHGQILKNGTVFVAGFGWPDGLTVDTAGNIYVADGLNGYVVKVTPSGTQSLVINGLTGWPVGGAVDASGNYYVCDQGNNRVVKITSGGVQSTVGSGLSDPQGVAVDANGNVLIADSNNNRVVMVTPSGTQMTIASGFSLPTDVAVYRDGTLYVADHNNAKVAKLTDPSFASVASPSSGVTLTLYTTGGTTTAVPITNPSIPNFVVIPGTAYDISFSGTFTGNATVCIDYSASNVQGSQSTLRMLHFSGGNWNDITSAGYPDTVNHVVCGVTSSLSPFVLANAVAPVGYNPQWLIITLFILTVVGGHLLRKRLARQ